MDLRTIIVILVRRWYVAVPIAVLFLFLAAGSGGAPSYSVDASFLLVPTTIDTENQASNPILDTPAAVNAAANVATVVMQSETRRAAVADAGYSPGYSFAVARNDPFVTLAVTDSDPDRATESATVLANLFSQEIAEQQLRFGADPNALVRAELLEVSDAEADYSSVRTSQAIVAFAGFVIAFMAAFAVEGVVYFFSDRRREFAEYDRYERDAARHGMGGESAAEFRPTGSDLTHLRPAASDDERPSPGSRWTRARRSRSDE